MEAKTQIDKTIVVSALALGALGGLLLGSYLWRNINSEHSLSSHLGTLSKVVEEVENFDLDEADLLKERIENLIKTIKESYGES
ncbi:MAG: hypothetical protein KAI08_00910 [Bacteroidales bacterium]|nr:hypothetical protein [Bacteroidales bacterium]